MTRKSERFGLPTGVPLEDLANSGEAEAGSFVMEMLPLERIEPDPENPRRLGLDHENPRNIDSDDPEWERKKEVLAGIEGLAINIRRYGVQEPIKVYPFGSGWRIVFGERRYHAARLAEKKDIPAWVLPKRPKFLRTLQFSENEHHEKLPAWERLENVRMMVEEFESYGEESVSSATDLADLTGLKLSQANNYYDILMGPEDIKIALQARNLGNIQLAAEIARESDTTKRLAALAAAQAGATTTVIREQLKAQAKPRERHPGRGRPAAKVSFGGTKKASVAKYIIEKVLGGSDQVSEILGEETDWNDFASVTKAWSRLIVHLERLEK